MNLTKAATKLMRFLSGYCTTRSTILAVVLFSLSTPLCGSTRSLSRNNRADTDSLYLYEAALRLDGRDYVKALDTMRLYCEQHPYATEYPGQIILGLRYTHEFTGKLSSEGVDRWKRQYAWLEKAWERNDQWNYQYEVLSLLCAALSAYDRNGAANLWYNFTLLFPEAYERGWSQIKNIREYQGYIGEDTTAFFIIAKFQPKAIVALSKSGDNAGLLVRSLSTAGGRLTLEIETLCQQDLAIEVYDVLGIRHAFESMSDQVSGTREWELRLDFTGPAFVIVRSKSGSQTIPIVVR